MMLSVLSARASGSMGLTPIARGLGIKPAERALQCQKVLCYRTSAQLNQRFESDATFRQKPEGFRNRGRDFGDGGHGGDFGHRDRGRQFGNQNYGRPSFNSRGSGFQARSSQVNDEILDGTVDKKDQYVTKFADLATSDQVSRVIVDTITQDMGLETMTPVQSQTISETLGGIDVIAQARTGTGKTLAFLVPILQNILAKDPNLAQPLRRRFRRDPDIRAVIISPTRELAEQIAVEARRLVAKTAVAVQTAVGGTQKRLGMQMIMNDGCHILVGTPGRIKDIISDQMYNLDLSSVNGFVLDEADRLLDDGFFPDIQEIEGYMPPKDVRQNMLFSATVPREVLDLAKEVLNPNFRFVQTIQKGEQQTHDKIPQKMVTLNGLENQFPALLELVLKGKASVSENMPFKALVFLNSTAETKAYASFFHGLRRDRSRPLGSRFPVFEIHSRLTQNARQRQADGFRDAREGIMFTSDVSARGMDYPNVTHVIQLGLPRSRDYYIHRIGRTGRGNKSGQAWILLSPFELQEAKKILRGLPIASDDSLACASVDMHGDDALDPEIQRVIATSRDAAKATQSMEKYAAFKGSLGYNTWVFDKKIACSWFDRPIHAELG